MRKPFAFDPTLDVLPIRAVPLDTNSRHEIIPILAALQHIYSNATLRDQILGLISNDVNKHTSPEHGRKGMDYWHILVLAATRLGLNLDYDALGDLANNHYTLRRIMGIGRFEDMENDREMFSANRIMDNLSSLTESTLEKINVAIHQEGHVLDPEAPKNVRGDTFVVETNIHYPTDSSVLGDGLRKIIELSFRISQTLKIPGWRQSRHLAKQIKRLLIKINKACSSRMAGAIVRRKNAYRPLLKLARKVLQKGDALVRKSGRFFDSDQMLSTVAAVEELKKYLALTRTCLDNTTARVMKEEHVPNKNKIFSVFEPHTECVNRGKKPQAVEFGRRVLIIEDSAGFIVHYKIIDQFVVDSNIGVENLRSAQEKCNDQIESASFDRGFFSAANEEKFRHIVDNICVPARGGRQEERQKAEATEEFKRNRRRHPGIESAINGIHASNGLNRCRDHGEHGMGRYVGIAILGRNLQVLGRLVLERQKAGCPASHTKRAKIA